MHNPNLQIELIKAYHDELRRRTSRNALARAASEQRSDLRHAARRSFPELIGRHAPRRIRTYIPNPQRTP
jgi:hypothetical protein